MRLLLRSLAALGLLACAWMAIAGAIGLQVTPAVDAQERAAKPALKAFRGCDHMRGYLRGHLRAYPLELFNDGARAEGDAAAPAEAGSDSSPTNVQEQGVDEPDIVKVDGSVILALDGTRLRSVDVSGEDPRLLDSVAVPEGPGKDPYLDGTEMLIAGDRALLITRSYPRTVISEFDVGDPAELRAVATMTLEGDYVSARLNGETARVIVSGYPDLPQPEGRGNGRAWLPRSSFRDRTEGTLERGKLARCGEVRRPRRFSGTGMLTVLTIDLAQGLPAVDTDAVMTDGRIAYASPSTLYVATERWHGAAPSGPSTEVSTSIHRFAIDDPLATEYTASGQVPGYMLSQWSMSEHEGLLRVASTTSPPWWGPGTRESESIVTVLAEDSGRLVEVGSVGGLGRDESIYAVRFIGEVGYVVTFRQIDPLYVVDLSDPSDPRLRGELKVPGYSAYLHPVGDGRLLGIGQDATPQGELLGAQLSLFDVADLDAPVRLDLEELGRDSRSEVEFNHRALLFSAQHGLGVLPLAAPGTQRDERFYGAAAFRLDPGGEIEAVTRLSHGDSREEKIRRALIVGERLFTVSAAGVMAHDLDTLASEAYLPF